MSKPTLSGRPRRQPAAAATPARRARPLFAGEAAPRRAARGRGSSASRMQSASRRRSGFAGITDGEFRRTFFHVDFLEQLDGVRRGGQLRCELPQGRRRRGRLPATDHEGHESQIRHAGHPGRRLRVSEALTSDATPKVAIPSPTMLHFRGGRQAIDQGRLPGHGRSSTPTWPPPTATRSPISHRAAAAICSSTTPTSPISATRKSAKRRALAATTRTSCRELYCRLINDASGDRPDDMAVCIHLCRGNFRSAWVAEGGYEPVAEVLFNELAVDGFFLEYDDARSGDFAPLRFVPQGQDGGARLVTSRSPELETGRDFKRRDRRGGAATCRSTSSRSARNAASPRPCTATSSPRTISGASSSGWSRRPTRSGRAGGKAETPAPAGRRQAASLGTASFLLDLAPAPDRAVSLTGTRRRRSRGHGRS